MNHNAHPDMALVQVASLILLHPDDNVLVCVAPITAGQTITIDAEPLASPQPVAVGHKVARRDLSPGDKVFKYGAPIGSATAPVVRGEHLHMHNMQSDYIPSHTRTRQEGSPRR